MLPSPDAEPERYRGSSTARCAGELHPRRHRRTTSRDAGRGRQDRPDRVRRRRRLDADSS